MIRYEPAAGQQFDDLLEIIFHQQSAYLRPVLDLIQITWDEFGWLFRTTGTAYRILTGKQLAGVCWVEIRGRVLYLNGLIIQDEFQGQGIGTQTLSWLEETFSEQVDAIELDVHAGNTGAKALYERCGYIVVDTVEQAGFYRMRKPVSYEQSAGEILEGHAQYAG